MKRSILLGLAIFAVAFAAALSIGDTGGRATTVPQPASVSSPATAATGNQPTVIG